MLGFIIACTLIRLVAPAGITKSASVYRPGRSVSVLLTTTPAVGATNGGGTVVLRPLKLGRLLTAAKTLPPGPALTTVDPTVNPALTPKKLGFDYTSSPLLREKVTVMLPGWFLGQGGIKDVPRLHRDDRVCDKQLTGGVQGETWTPRCNCP
ncbi:hypothetical protein CTA1_8131 [Colletotrichum tanaceti]|uniref:Uncharacterized protein n=1 Tax=Colletotrichum tanaceti TaxID=1306861 RepID=A0A4U6XI04_9PEZI|nr:hypothetical protein CTA1_8131 [Colletotrichum tanaceti]